MAEAALRSTSLKTNFHRLTRLLMRGGVQLLRETLDSIHSPADLPLRLADPIVQAQLRGAGLTRPERVCLYRSPGVYGKSNDFDITLIFKLFRTICSLTPPPGPRGWDDLPNGSDHTLVADLVRIKYYRNEIYGHRPTMEISDIDFIRLWEEISEALLRIANNISPAKREEWEKSIDDLLRNPLTPDEERCIEELETWYKQDMDVKSKLVDVKDELVDVKDEMVKLRNEVRSQRPVVIVIQMDLAGHHQAAGSQPTLLVPNLFLSEPEQAAGADDPEPNNPPDIDVWNVILSFKESVHLFLRYLGCKLHLLVRNNEVGSWHITVECSSLQVLEGLWEDYRGGHLNSVAQEMLITPQVLAKLGLTELKLKTFISEDQYEKGKKLFEANSGAEDKDEIQRTLQATMTKTISEGSIEPELEEDESEDEECSLEQRVDKGEDDTVNMELTKVPRVNLEVHRPSHKEEITLLLNEIRKHREKEDLLQSKIASLREEGKANLEAHEAEIWQMNEKERALKRQIDENERVLEMRMDCEKEALRRKIDEKERALREEIDEKEKALQREIDGKEKLWNISIAFSILFAAIFITLLFQLLNLKGLIDEEEQALRRKMGLKGHMDGKEQALRRKMGEIKEELTKQMDEKVQASWRKMDAKIQASRRKMGEIEEELITTMSKPELLLKIQRDYSFVFVLTATFFVTLLIFFLKFNTISAE